MKSNKDKFEWNDKLIKDFATFVLATDRITDSTNVGTCLEIFKNSHYQPKYPEGIVKFKAIKAALADTFYTLHKEGYQTWATRLIEQGQEIYTVKNSKGEEFSIGDELITTNTGEKINFYGTVASFYIEAGMIIANLSLHGKQEFSINNLTKHKKQPLFTTEDGFGIFMGDYISFVITSVHPWMILHEKVTSEVSAGAWKRFKERSNAETWVEKNKPKYSEQQILDALEHARTNIGAFKRKLGIK